MYGKIINNKLYVIDKQIKTATGWITNPTEEQLKANGYKEVVYDDISQYEYNDEEEKLVEVYGETETRIDVAYDIVALTDEEHNEVILTKIIEEENKITPRRQREVDLKKEGALEFVQKVEDNIAALRAILKRIFGLGSFTLCRLFQIARPSS